MRSWLVNVPRCVSKYSSPRHTGTGAPANASPRCGAETATITLGSPGKAQINYFNDNFGFRDRLIRWSNTFRFDWLHVSPSPKVLLGRGKWFYYTGDWSLDDLRRTKPLSPELEKMKREFFRPQGPSNTAAFTAPQQEMVALAKQATKQARAEGAPNPMEQLHRSFKATHARGVPINVIGRDIGK